ncbi:serine hydrolase domain-containing protein [Flavobacterium sp. '19STA2R22 D10 B1']|uniref:serine hydrolase domain-containing protein n=1 Tax=Flavobacterium aerium TaxID=3037261 RepID=UPI00278BB05B|nr:serine hydrolase [Flavobacterium sp. '19STA2R22 D10 B1']
MKNLIILCILLYNSFCIAQSTVKPQDTSLLEMTKAINNGYYPKVHSVLIAKGNQLLYENYFNGYTNDSLHDTRSSFKSITSLLIGIAIDKGFIRDVNQNIYQYFPNNFAFRNDYEKQKITIKNLLEMKSGIDCEEFYETKNCEDDMEQSKDWVNYSLNIPMKYKPDEVWAYNSINPMILSGIIRVSANMSVMDFAKKYLFEPLEITNYRWTVDPAGNGMTAGSFYIRPLDMLKIGQLVQNNGVWKNQQIISKKWIDESTACYTAIPNFSFMKSSKSKSGDPQPTYYGYYWYRELLKTKDLQYDVLFASGNGGQYIFTIKELDLTVVFTQGNYGSYKAKQAFEILEKYILPQFKTTVH